MVSRLNFLFAGSLYHIRKRKAGGDHQSVKEETLRLETTCKHGILSSFDIHITALIVLVTAVLKNVY